MFSSYGSISITSSWIQVTSRFSSRNKINCHENRQVCLPCCAVNFILAFDFPKFKAFITARCYLTDWVISRGKRKTIHVIISSVNYELESGDVSGGNGN